MKIELTTQEAIQLIKEHLGTANEVEVNIISEQIAKDEDEDLMNKNRAGKKRRRLLVDEVQRLVSQGDKSGAIDLVNGSINSLGLVGSKFFVEMNDGEFNRFIDTGRVKNLIV